MTLDYVTRKFDSDTLANELEGSEGRTFLKLRIFILPILIYVETLTIIVRTDLYNLRTDVSIPEI